MFQGGAWELGNVALARVSLRGDAAKRVQRGALERALTLQVKLLSAES